MTILLFPLAFLFLSVYSYLWYERAKDKRNNRIKRLIYQKMAERRIDPWELAKIVGVEPSFILQLLNGKRRVDAVAASGLVIAFPQTDLTYWYENDMVW